MWGHLQFFSCVFGAANCIATVIKNVPESGVNHKIDKETKKKYLNRHTLVKRIQMECCNSRLVFITIEDHTRNFRNNSECRPINLAKSELGLYSNKHLENIIANIVNNTKVNQWKNTITVIDWFKSCHVLQNFIHQSQMSCLIVPFHLINYN